MTWRQGIGLGHRRGVSCFWGVEPVALRLRHPDSQAHIEDLKDRLYAHFAGSNCCHTVTDDEAELIELLAIILRAMDREMVATKDVLEIFSRRVPRFSFAKWLVDMVDEDVYLDTSFADTRFRQAA